MLADPHGVGDGGQGRVDGADAGEEAGVDDVEVVNLVGLAVDVEHRGGRIGAEAAGADLVGYPGDRYVHGHVEVLVEHVVLGQTRVVENLLELLVEALGLFVIGGGVGQVDVAVSVEGDPILGLGQVLGGEPPVHRMPGRVVQGPAGRAW